MVYQYRLLKNLHVFMLNHIQEIPMQQQIIRYLGWMKIKQKLLLNQNMEINQLKNKIQKKEL
ncbi:unnamed protein product [Paramecium sonneborni]|uniref:Uncharacterized protein n=1 Tax=Paramecium sonneborni TaxID=65129 RepID=A0A8S1KFN5_9CILI|nr:unnamed protein product [Paramecium sonneborni]